jgi:hypothetical protein
MVQKRFLFTVIIAACSLAIYSFVADDPINRIKQQLDKWTDQRPVEKVYLHLDKPYYAAGDDIWLKAYVTAGSYNQLTTISGVVNIELIDSRDSITRSVKLPLKGGVAAGDIALPDTLRQGMYRIRAYTNYMRNAGSEYFFDQPINIINTIARYAPKATDKVVVQKGLLGHSQPAKADVQFFPESGSLVAGVPTKVAFKAVSPDGLGANVQGVVTDSKGQQVASFTSSHLGMGAFNITPVSGATYTARITYGDGTSRSTALPKVTDRGYVLNITDTDAQLIRIKLSASKNLLNAGATLTLVGQVAGKIYYTGNVKPGDISIEKNKFPTGIVQFTLFTAAGEPLNERLVFVRNADRLELKVSADKQTYAVREKVNLTIDARNRGMKPAAGSFSVAVTDETKVPVDEGNESNIMADLLLTSDLKGYIEQPAYYFNNVSEKTRADLDVLMLTQGYHRFEWKEVLNDKFTPAIYQPERSLRVSGTITTEGGKPVAGGKVQLINFDDISYTMDTLTDARGRFVFDNLMFEDSLRFIVQARNSKNKKDVVIHLDSIAPANTASGYYRPAYDVSIINNMLSTYAQSSKELYSAQLKYGVGNHVISLQEVIIREKRQALKHSANLNGPGNADQVLLARDLRLMGCIRIADCLQGRLLGVYFRNGVPFSTRSNRPMQVIIDGVYVDAAFLNSINYFDIQAIEVLRNAGSLGIYGGRGGSGVLIITTKRGDDREEYTGPIKGRGIKPYYPKGFYKARTFYSPQYDKSGVNKQLADLRTTVYWNPDVSLDKDGRSVLQYFNAGSKGNYRVVVEGIDSDGNIGRQVFHYRVE